MQRGEDEWKASLTSEQYRVLRQKGTEVPGSGKYLYNDEHGAYHCAACGAAVFKSDAKYESTMPGLVGWPSFSEAASSDAVVLSDDHSMGMHRTEVSCAHCGSHLGHLFPDDSSPNGQHFCINSVALNFKAR